MRKLTQDSVNLVRTLANNDIKKPRENRIGQIKIGRLFKISQPTVSQIRLKRTWS